MGVEVYLVLIDMYFIYKVWYDMFEIIGKIKFLMIGDLIGCIICNFGVMIEDEGFVFCGIFVMNFEGEIKVIEIYDLGIGCSVKELVCKV